MNSMSIEYETRSKRALSGLLFSLEIDSDGSGAEVDIQAWNRSDKLVWAHLDLTEESVKEWLNSDSGLSEIAVTALTVEDTRPRLTAIDDGLLICLRGVNSNPGSDPDDMVALRLWITPNRIISLRHRSVQAVKDMKKSYMQSSGPQNVADFLVTLYRNITDRIGGVVNGIDDKVDAIEEEVLYKERVSLRTELSNYRRMIIQLKRYLAPQRETLLQLQNESTSWIPKQNRLLLRELTERTIRYVEDLDAARERATIIQEELNMRLTEQMNRTIYIMSIVATIFLPLSLLTGLLGINVGGIPGSNSPWGFLVVCSILVTIAIGEYFFFKKKQVL